MTGSLGAKIGVAAAALIVGAGLLASARSALGGAPAGEDMLAVSAQVSVTSRLGSETIPLEGTVTVVRSAPRTDGGLQVVDLEIVSMGLSGMSVTGPIQVSQSSTAQSLGEFRSLAPPPPKFPASSFFDVFFEVVAPASPAPTLTLRNLVPIHMVPVSGGSEVPLASWPPFGVTYRATPTPCVPLVPTQPAEVCVTMVSVTFAAGGGPTPTPALIADPPTFSLASGGPSGFDPAALLGLLPGAQLAVPCSGLGLSTGGCDGVAPQDNLDALSFGTDFAPGALLVADLPLAFSVAPEATGAPGTGVAAQAGCSPPQPQADIFVSALAGSNGLTFDGDGQGGSCPSATQLGLVETDGSDDVDALTDQPPNFVDEDGNGVPEGIVFFSLSSGSPTLQTLGRSAADILWVTGGVSPGVFAFAGTLGLQPGDDIDALCVASDGDTVFEPGFDTVALSLAPGSPTLAALGASPADILGPGPQLLVAAEDAGLAPGDDLNAIACGAAFPTVGVPFPTPTPTSTAVPTQTPPPTATPTLSPTEAPASPTPTPESTPLAVNQLPQTGSGLAPPPSKALDLAVTAGVLGALGVLAVVRLAWYRLRRR